MDQEVKYANKFNIATTNLETVIDFVQQQPMFDEKGVITVTEKTIAKVVLPFALSENLLAALADCLAKQKNNMNDDGVNHE